MKIHKILFRFLSLKCYKTIAIPVSDLLFNYFDHFVNNKLVLVRFFNYIIILDYAIVLGLPYLNSCKLA